MLQRVDPVTQMRWIGVTNLSGTTIPAFAAMRVIGVDLNTDLIQVAQPNADNQEVLFNGPVHIPASQKGEGTRDFPAYALYDNTDGTPKNGDQWGAAAGSWKLRANRTGYYIYGGATGSRVKVVGVLGGTTVGGQGTLSVPLRVVSRNVQNGLSPAVILSYDPNRNPRFQDTAVQVWAITTNENLLELANYTGIYLITGGTPARPIFCINDNLVVQDTLGQQLAAGVNQIILDPPYTWSNTPVKPGQAMVERLFQVGRQFDLPNLYVQHVFKETFTSGISPGSCWSVTPGIPGEALIQRIFNVQNQSWPFGANPFQYTDVNTEMFVPDFCWSVTLVGGGQVAIQRLLGLHTDTGPLISDVYDIQFQPYWTWTLNTPAAGKTQLTRIFNVSGSTGGPPIVYPDIFQIDFLPPLTVSGVQRGEVQVSVAFTTLFTFYPACAWNIQGNQIERLLTFKTDGAATPVQDVASVTLHPDNCWQLGSNNPNNQCDLQLQRIFIVTGTADFGDTYRMLFKPDNTWKLSAPQPGQVTVTRVLLVGTPQVQDVYDIEFLPADFTVTGGNGIANVAINPPKITQTVLSRVIYDPITGVCTFKCVDITGNFTVGAERDC